MDNLQIVSRQNDVAPFYNEASIVLNLSDKRRFVETFGLTALEAMSAGLLFRSDKRRYCRNGGRRGEWL